MKRTPLLALTTLLALAPAFSQEAPAPREHVKVYAKESGLVLPQILPLIMPPLPSGKCSKKIDGDVLLSALVGEDGVPHNIMLLKPVGSDADEFAVKIASASRFHPGMLDGKPVVTAISLKLSIQACVTQSTGSNGKINYSAQLSATPLEVILPPIDSPANAVFSTNRAVRSTETSAERSTSIQNGPRPGESVPTSSIPVPLLRPNANYTEEARAHHIQGDCLVALIVDANGLPRNFHIVRGLDMGLDQEALIAVSKYRFKPAILDGEPVATPVNVVVHFLLK